MKLLPFFWRYFRRYGLWAVGAGVAVLVFAISTAAVAALIEPIFGEVLLAGDQVPGPLGMLGGGGRGGAPSPGASPGESSPGEVGQGEAGTAGAGPGEADKGEMAEERGEVAASPLERWAHKLNLKALFRNGYESLKRRAGIRADEVVYFVPLLFVLVFLLRGLASFVSGYGFQRIGLGVTTDIRNSLYRHILGQSSRFFARHPSGELVARVVSDVSVMQNAVSSHLLDLFQQSVTLVLLLILLLSTHFKLALICLVVAPLLIYPIVRFGKGMRRTSHRSQERLADLTALLSEGVRGYRVVKAFGMEDFEHDRFALATRRHLRVNLRAQLLANLSGPVVESMAVVGAAALLVYAGKSIRAGTLTAPMLVAFLGNLLMMYDPIRKLNKVNLILQQALAAAQRVASIMAIDTEVAEGSGVGGGEGAEPLTTVRESILYEGVSFAYDEEDGPVLESVDLEIRKGQIVALVGPSGAGKSTLVNLLPRFFDPTAGRVLIDGRDIRDLPLANLRSLIGIVTQETMLFDDTIRANIAYGRADLPLEPVRAAAVAAYADEFIRDLPAGYDTRVGEAGLRLSGGQRQRLAIARALLKNAPILILDEATSQLDSESESLVQKALYNLMQGRTTLVIAHRLSTVMQADRILVVEAGRIVEEGTHGELLSSGGTYRRLYDLQFRP